MTLSSRLRSAWRPTLVVLSLYLLVGGSIVSLLAVSIGQLLAALVLLTVVVLVVVRMGGDGASDTDSESESIWNAIPSWQYDGRHVESGGLTRGEQEQALQEISEDAAQRHGEQHHRK
ncbi:MAG: hypothetical protein ACOC0Z_08935 [Halohasta sp.]